MNRLLLWLVFPAAIAAAQENSLRGDLQRAWADSARSSTPLSTDTEQLAQAAAAAFREGRLGEAVDAYDRAAAEAFRGGATGRAFEFGLAAAEIQRQRGEAADAADRYRRAALGNANDPRAVKAHHAACVAAGRLLSAGASQAELAAYDDLLREHVEGWPLSSTTADASWRRIELLALRGAWRELSQFAREVGPEHPRYPRAGELLLAAYRGRLASRELESVALVEGATDDLLPRILDAGGLWPAEWTPLQRDAALLLAQAHLGHRADGAPYAAQLLRVALKSQPPPTPDWRRGALPLLACADLMTGGAADQTLAEEIASPEERGRLLARVDETLRRSGPLAAAADLRATLDALAPLSGKGASGNAAIEALLVAGRDEEALARLAERSAANPNDREAQASYARQLAASRDPADLAQARRLWRSIETRSSRRTPEWFEARLARTRLTAALGDRDNAVKLLRLTRLTAPDLGGEPYAREFTALAESLR